MEEEITHLVINWISFEKNEILVGATDNERWRWDTEEGMSGGDAKSIVCATLIDNGKGFAVEENATFFCLPGDHTRAVAMANLYELFAAAWTIKNEKLDFYQARERFFGKEINKPSQANLN